MSRRQRVEPMKTVSVFSTTAPKLHCKLTYMAPTAQLRRIDRSRPSDVSLPSYRSRPAQRAAQVLPATFQATQVAAQQAAQQVAQLAGQALPKTIVDAYGADLALIVSQDPLAQLALAQPKPTIRLEGRTVPNTPSRRTAQAVPVGQRRVAFAALAQQDTNVLSTPKRMRETQYNESASKRRAVRLTLDGESEPDVNEDTVLPEAVLRMVDASLVETPDRFVKATPPQVRSAAPGPSPKPSPSVYAYDKRGHENVLAWTRPPNPWRRADMPPPGWWR